MRAKSLMLIMLMLSGCSSAGPEPCCVDISGTWHLTYVDQNGSQKTADIKIAQDEQSLEGEGTTVVAEESRNDHAATEPTAPTSEITNETTSASKTETKTSNNNGDLGTAQASGDERSNTVTLKGTKDGANVHFTLSSSGQTEARSFDGTVDSVDLKAEKGFKIHLSGTVKDSSTKEGKWEATIR